jgi:hypothetical protein
MQTAKPSNELSTPTPTNFAAQPLKVNFMATLLTLIVRNYQNLNNIESKQRRVAPGQFKRLIIKIRHIVRISLSATNR